MDNFLDMADSLADRIDRSEYEPIGLVFGVLVCREILERLDEKEAAQLIHQGTVKDLLERVASGDLVIQDHLISGATFDPQIEQAFHSIAAIFLKRI